MSPTHKYLTRIAKLASRKLLLAEDTKHYDTMKNGKIYDMQIT